MDDTFCTLRQILLGDQIKKGDNVENFGLRICSLAGCCQRIVTKAGGMSLPSDSLYASHEVLILYRITAACVGKYVVAPRAPCSCVALFPWPKMYIVSASHLTELSRGALGHCFAFGVYLPSRPER